jgi:hypothetical protein
MEPKKCPKCSKTLTAHEITFGIPAYLHPVVSDRTGEAVTTRNALPIILYYCAPDCRYIELYMEPKGH